MHHYAHALAPFRVSVSLSDTRTFFPALYLHAHSATQLASAFAHAEAVTVPVAAPRWEVSLAMDGDAMTVPQVVAMRSSRNGDGAAAPVASYDDDYSHLGSEPPRHAQHKAASRGAVLAWAAAAAVDTSSATRSASGDSIATAAAAEPFLAPRLSSADVTATRARYDALLALHPGHPLLLRNYARFLIDVCDDAVSAAPMLAAAVAARDANEEWGGDEEFDGTACGMSGVLLATTARNVWVATRDGPAASRLFDAALQVAPNDCYVLAAYTAFLWQWEDHSCVSGPCGSDWGSSEATPASHYDTGDASFGDANSWAR